MIDLTVADYPRFVNHARFELLPKEYQQGFRNYVERGIAPGHTLLQVLEGNIRALISFGDVRALYAIVHWCINELPAPLWGSKKRVRQWMKVARDYLAAEDAKHRCDFGRCECQKCLGRECVPGCPTCTTRAV